MITDGLPDPATLNPLQLDEVACALCARLLEEIRQDRLIGRVEVGQGFRRRIAELWACAPTCAEAVRR
ncbi:hypothetical protein ACIP9H_40605 [Streptomyces sp. NPDC088732]|uniref:hypothetical protein n=1 Tax=Streptomyces sp. NPDC088732 TaxID=3365879 RepID=UPI003813B233